MGGLFNTVKKNLSQVGIIETAIRVSLQTSERPFGRWCVLQLVSLRVHHFHEVLFVQLCQVSQFWDVASNDVLHPFTICGGERRVPVVEDSEFDGDDISCTSFDTIASSFDFATEVKRPGGICSGSVQDGCDVILEHNSGEETNVDIPSDLEEVLVLPKVISVGKVHVLVSHVRSTYHFCDPG